MENTELINGLNEQFNREVNALLRYLIEAAALNDADHESVRRMYLREVGEKMQQAQSLADEIVAMGGTPALQPHPISLPSTVREMLKHDAAEESTDEKNYLHLACEAEKEHLVDLKLRLEQQAIVENQHRYEMECSLW